MYKKKNKYPNCKKCEVGFVELDKDNYIVVGIIEQYGLQPFVDGMGGINTNSIKNVLEAEGYENYKDLFHKLVLYITTALSTSRQK